jgi:branched-chain amino acid transport system permease protein
MSQILYSEHYKPIATTLAPRWMLTACLLALLVWSYSWQSYPLYVLTQILLYGIAVMGLNLLAGYTGQISVGHSAFFALGAYAVAIMDSQLGWPYFVSLPASAVACFAAGYLFGFPALRLPMLYLALSTFAIAVVTPQTLKWKKIEWLTGGVQGLVLHKPDFGPFSTPWCIAMATALAALAAYVFGRRLLGSQFGRLIDAARDHPLAAEASGIDVTAIKTQVFGLSAAYTGLAGGLSAMAGQFVSPESFPFLLSVSLLVGSFVGGIRSLWGAFIGAAFIVLTPNFAESISKSAPWLIFGLTLLLVVFLAPQGVAGATTRK